MEMIKMKKILNSGIIALCLVFSGCDWLDINPETGLDETEAVSYTHLTLPTIYSV